MFKKNEIIEILKEMRSVLFSMDRNVMTISNLKKKNAIRREKQDV